MSGWASGGLDCEILGSEAVIYHAGRRGGRYSIWFRNNGVKFQPMIC